MAFPKVLALPLLASLLSLASQPTVAGNTQLGTSNAALMRGLDLASRKYPEEAAAEFEKCKDLAPATAHQLSIIASTYFEAGNSSASLKVIDYALSQERVKQNKVEFANLLDLRGSTLSYLERRDEAVASYKMAAAVNPDKSLFFWAKAGQELMKNQKYTEALPILEKSLKPNGMNGFIYQDIGHCYLEMKNPAKAIAPLIASIDSFQAARKGNTDTFLPKLIQSHKYLVKAYEETNNPKEAVIWQKRLDILVNDLSKDFFGSH